MSNKKLNECFQGLENIHKGNFIHIIVSPSLAETDLSLIKDSPSIAMNRISLLIQNLKTGSQLTMFSVLQTLLTQSGVINGQNQLCESLSKKVPLVL